MSKNKRDTASRKYDKADSKRKNENTQNTHRYYTHRKGTSGKHNNKKQIKNITKKIKKHRAQQQIRISND